MFTQEMRTQMEKGDRNLKILKEIIKAEVSHTNKDSIKGDNLIRKLHVLDVDNKDT